MKSFICGTACLFKSTIILRLKSQGYKAKVGDYKEACDKYAFLKNKACDPVLTTIYNAYTVLNEEEGAVHDRCVIDAIVYDCLLKNMPTDEFCAYIEKFKMLNEKWLTSNYFIFLVAGNAAQTLDRMLKRNNGIDEMTIEYVEKQNTYFALAARLLKKELVTIFEFNDMEVVVNKIAANHGLRMDKQATLVSGKIKPNYPQDAGIDMYTAVDTVLPPNQITKVKLHNRVLIEDGHYGRLVARSSTQFIVIEGIIDAGYTGELFFKAVNVGPAPIALTKDCAYVQLIITAFSKNYRLVDEHCIASKKTRRGDKGFGSTS
ncbi:dUTPase [Dasychira pudibunda nucleopolyhedrovirus]|nr:dUTPase [Dasychira pudibunda nucleopolyhedrovirus]WHM28430.1 dUTPase [Dasychira pudibunda nucleopolyhedrovirus]